VKNVRNAKNEHQLEHKNQVRNWRYLECGVFEYERLYLILGFEHINVKGYLNFNKNIEKKNLFNLNRVFKQKVVSSTQYFCTNDHVEMRASYIFHFPTRILTSTHPKWFNIFFHKSRRDV